MLAPWVLALGGCSKDETATSDPTTPVTTNSAITPPLGAEPAHVPSAAGDITGVPPSTVGTGTKTNSLPTDAGVITDAGTPTDAGTSDAGKGDAGVITDAGITAPNIKACSDKCQPAFQSCLTPSFNDAGIPQIKDPAACQAALQACLQGCKP
ncbi:hypothetical protein [Chondromyces apiculatus]|nr:hypothetical protein [Chondromyces apiculatus]